MDAYLARLREQILAHIPRTEWHNARIFVPHPTAAATLRHALKPCGAGVLPEAVNIENAEAYALLLGIEIPPPANPWPVRAQALVLLETTYPEVDAAALIPRCEELLQTLNLLAAYEVTPAALAASVPASLRPLWDAQAQVLQALWASVYADAAQSIPAARRVQIWQAIDAALQINPQHPPSCWWGDEPDEPALKRVYYTLKAQGMQTFKVAEPATHILQYQAPQPLHEMQQATLWAAEQLAQAVGPIGVVASGAFANRFATEMQARYGINPRTTGGLRWYETPRGAALLHAARFWPSSSKQLSLAYWLEPLLAELGDEAEGLKTALQPLIEMPQRVQGSTAYAWLKLALEALAPRTEHDDEVQDARLVIVPPHRLVGQPFAALWVAEGVEGVWPITPKIGTLSMGQRRALGMPTAEHQAQEAYTLWQAAQRQGGTVVYSRSAHDEMVVPLTPSRWWPHDAHPYVPTFTPQAYMIPRAAQPMGVWQPATSPERLSASMLQALLACPYKAYAERVLKLNPLDPLIPEPDPRDSGTVVHAWLENGLRHTPHVNADNAEALVAFMRESIPSILADAPPVLQVVWAPRLQRLAPEIVAWWQARGGTWQTERKLTAHMAGATVHATLDAFTANGSKGAEIIDYKTGTPPAKGKLKTGEAPQLPIEAWLAAQAGTPIETLTYVQVKGYGETPLRATAMPAAPLVEPVAESLKFVLEKYFQPKAAWPALPDATGLGVLPTGACKTCALSGVCRRAEGVA